MMHWDGSYHTIKKHFYLRLRSKENQPCNFVFHLYHFAIPYVYPKDQHSQQALLCFVLQIPLLIMPFSQALSYIQEYNQQGVKKEYPSHCLSIRENQFLLRLFEP